MRRCAAPTGAARGLCWSRAGSIRTSSRKRVAAYRRGHYERIVTSGGPIEPWPDAGGWRDFASRAAGTLRAQGLAGVPIVSVPAPEADRDRTWRSALAVREWAERSGTPLGSIDVFTSGVHARRSQLATRLAMGRNTEVGVIAAHRSGYDAGRWWRSSESAKATIGEAFSWGWTVCCFWPGDPASMPPRSPSMPPQPRSP